jgi:hypothetical protein
MLPPTTTTPRPYPCDPWHRAAGRESGAGLAASVARFARHLAAAIRGYRARRRVRRVMERQFQLLQERRRPIRPR